MREPAGIEEVQRFRNAIARRLGLHFDEAKLGYLSEVLERRTELHREPLALYLDRIESNEPLRAELRALAQELTVAETYFFRYFDQFRAFAEAVVPDAHSSRASARRLSLLSAGCASGEEAYSLAILARERLSEPAWEVSIRAVEVNPASLEKARRGRYSAWALRETPDPQRRWFRAEGREFQLDPVILAAVQFEERNLAQPDAELWPVGAYDAVFCRNVLMYMTPEHGQALIARITRSLVPGGHLFLGHAETLRGMSQDYHLRHTHGTFYYQRKDGLTDAPLENSRDRFLPAAARSPTGDLDWTASWIETVQRSSERIQALAQTPRRGNENGAAASLDTRSRPAFGATLDLLRKERFSEALESLRELPPEQARDPDALLLRAVLLTHSGDFERSEQVCHELLATDDLNAGAYYLLALCSEGRGDRKGAVDHDQVATYLDSAFAMPRLHLGLLARGAGDRDAARRELGQALSLLQREEASRLLLFGGGFSREALVALCRSELLAAGGQR